MRTPDPTKDNARGQAGTVGEAAIKLELNKVNHAPHGATERPCCCRPGATTCITCLTWDRTIRGHEARRAESLRLQAIGRRVAGGSI